MINTVTILGRLTKEPEMSKTTGGTTSARFTIAVDKRNAKQLKDQGKPSTNFIPCKAYGVTAETIGRFFSKGSEIGVTGYLDTWEVTSQNGQKRFGMDLVVNEFSFTSGTNRSQNASNEATEPSEWPEPLVRVDDDSLPF